ncbi:MAG: leucine-rich repeat protein [Bacteroidales bacterium]|nr:leucine-rich repeat protein [Bacteroidales bacterium]
MKQNLRYLGLTAVLLLCSQSMWAYEFESNGFYYNILQGEELAVELAYPNMSNQYSGSVTVPSEVTYMGKTYKVTRLGSYVFSGCEALTDISLPESVTSIGDGAFSNSKSLVSVPIHDGVKAIGNQAFQNCSSLTGITMNGVTSIGQLAFDGCSALTNISISDNLTSLNSSVFKGCTSLKSFSIPEGVTSIGYEAFSGCTGLEELTIPSAVTYISQYAFLNCTGKVTIKCDIEDASYLESSGFCHSKFNEIIVDEGVTKVGNYAFVGISDLKKVTIPSSVTSWGDKVFYNDTLETVYMDCDIADGCFNMGSKVSVSKMVIGDHATKIGYGAFYGCSELQEITIGKNVTEIGTQAFDCCTGLKNVTIPEGVTSIGMEGFNYCTGLESITIPSTVTSIGERAFMGCSGTAYINCDIPDSPSTYGLFEFDEVIIGEGATKIGAYAFSGSKLTSISLPDGIKSIGKYAFYSCRELPTIELPGSVDSISDLAFYSCPSLTSIKLNEGLKCIGEYAFGFCSSLDSLVIPEGVTTIGDFAFYDCSEVKITLPSSVTDFGLFPFDKCTGTVRINCNIPDDDTQSRGLFRNSTLKEVVVGEDVTRIGSFSFKSAELSRVVLPSSLTYIGDYAFDGCSGTLIISGNLPEPTESYQSPFSWAEFEEAVFAEGVTRISKGNFYCCEKLKKVTLPNSVTVIGENAFYQCISLEKVDIPNSVTEIGSRAFGNCRSFTSIVIPASVATIGDDAFEYCNNLTSVYVNALVPPTIGTEAFSGVDISNCMLYVPDGFEDAYRNAEVWKNFKNMAVNPYVTVEKKAVIYMVDGEEYHVDSVAITANIVAIDAPTKEGYTFSGWSEIPESMPANDVVVTGTFSINTYAVIYMVDGVEVHRDSVVYGGTITLAEAPTKESYDFSGWSGYPEDLIMPAADVVITGSFTNNDIADVLTDNLASDKTYFDLTGKRLSQPKQGINVVKSTGGKRQKVILKNR